MVNNTHSEYSPLYISSALLSTNVHSNLVEQSAHYTEQPESMPKRTTIVNIDEHVRDSENNEEKRSNTNNKNNDINIKNSERDKLNMSEEKENSDNDDIELLIEEILERIPWAPQVIRVNTLYCRLLLLDSNFDETAPYEPHDKRKGKERKDQNNSKHVRYENLNEQMLKDESIACNTNITMTNAQTSPTKLNRRKLIRKHFSTTQKLLYLMQRCNATHHYNVFISFDWTLVTRALNAHEAAACFAKFYCMPRQMPNAENGVYIATTTKTSNTNNTNNTSSNNSNSKDFIATSSSMAINKMHEYESLEKWKDWWPSLLVQNTPWKSTEGKNFPQPPTSRLSSSELQPQHSSSTSVIVNTLAENICSAEMKSEGEKTFIDDLRALVRQWPYELTTPLNEIYIPYFGDDFTPPPLMEQAMLQSLEAADKTKKSVTLVSLTSSSSSSSCASSSSESESLSSSSSSSAEGDRSEESSTGKTPKSATLHTSTSTSTHAQAKIFTAEMLVPLLPTYFIPIEKLLEKLPEGYTTEHIHKLFGATDAIEMVTLQNKTFVRLYGGKNTTIRPVFDFDPSGDGAVVHDEYSSCYQPNPFLCYAFAPCFARTLE